jgi:phospholipid transport system transporter-binding protein
LRKPLADSAKFEVLKDERSRVVGSLDFATVALLLPLGGTAIAAGQASVIDLGAVVGSDSSGLALLIEWLSVAKGAGRSLRYENMPSQLQQLARLSEVDELLGANPAPGHLGGGALGGSAGADSSASGSTKGASVILPSETR